MKSIRIGLLVSHAFAYYRGTLRGVARYAAAKPEWQLTSLVSDAQLTHVPRRFRPDGLIASVNTDHVARTLSDWHRPLVSVSAVRPGMPFPEVHPDNAQVGELAAAHFLERGLRHFGFVGPPDYLFSLERKEAFGRAVREAGYEVAGYDGQSVLPFDPLGERWDLGPAVARWLKRLPKPAGVFVPSDLWGVQVAEACRVSGLRVPEDVAILGVDNDLLYCELTRPPLSSIELPDEQIGYEAAALLDRMLSGGAVPGGPILLPPVGVAVRRSTEVLAIDDPDVVAAIRYVREHPHLPLRVDDVLGQVSVGRRTLERRCHAALGWGLGEEIRRAHLEQARRLLAATDLPMKVVAERAGFSDCSHMDLVFRQDLGLTPTNYRSRTRSPK